MAIIVLLIMLGNIIGAITVAYGLTGYRTRVRGTLLTLIGLAILVGDWYFTITFLEALKR